MRNTRALSSETTARTTEPFTIVVDKPQRHLRRRLAESSGNLIGSIILVLGLTASIPAVPATLAVFSFLLGWATTEPTDPDPWPAADVPVKQIVLAWAVISPIAVGGMRFGLRLLRRNRRLVLFLRRFGYDDAQSAVTFAVMRTIGASWRIVTLDDAEMAPIGVAAGVRRAFGAGRVVFKYGLAIGHFIGLRTFPRLVIVMWSIVALGLLGPAIEFARTGATSPDPWIHAVNPFVAILASVFDGRPPLDALGPTLPGIFALLAIASMISFFALIATMVVLLLALPLSTVLFFVTSSADSVDEAERSKTVAVTSRDELLRMSGAIVRRSRKVFGPRLVVLRVASSIWQNAVQELASLASLTVIDISEPTANVVWELRELTERFGNKCLLIGQHERVAALAALRPEDQVSASRQLVALLEGREVLAYTTDPEGLKRFARGLRGLLLERT